MTAGYGEWVHNGRRYTVAFAADRLFVERQDKPNLVGGIARGKIDRVIGKAAFVRLPDGATGYLEAKQGLKPGEELLIQVSTYATEGKAWPLATELKLQGRRYIHLPHGSGIRTSKRLPADMAQRLSDELRLDFNDSLPGGWIIRSGADGDRATNAAEAKTLASKAAAIDAKSDTWLVKPPGVTELAESATGNAVTAQLLPDDLADRMEALLSLDIRLANGARLRLCPTPACFTIDVDSGSSGKIQPGALASGIISAIKSRNIAGQIVIDPLREISRELLGELDSKVQDERELQLTLHGRTKMGLIELSRPRLGPSLYEALDD